MCEDELAAAIRETVLDIAHALDSYAFDRASLSGEAGAAIFYDYLDRMFPQAGFAARSDSLLSAAIEKASAAPLAPGLFDGFTGVGFAIEHLRPSDPTRPDQDANAEVDAVIAAALTRSPWPGPYDLLSGLVGFGVYALERAPRDEAIHCLNAVIVRLAELARPGDDGLTWWTDPRFMGAAARELPSGDHNLGVAHGVAGVIALVGRACALPAIAPHARAVLDGAVRWLLARRLPPGAGASFSYRAEQSIPARSAWCSGDPGIAAALLLAARSVKDPTWESIAVDVALSAAARATEQSGVVDAGLCHGAAGLAHLFNRLYHATREERFAEAARFWFRRTLAMRDESQTGLAGFVAQELAANGALRAGPAAGFLTGVVGIGLCLLGAISSSEPNWDRVLLCSIPPSAAQGQ